MKKSLNLSKTRLGTPGTASTNVTFDWSRWFRPTTAAEPPAGEPQDVPPQKQQRQTAGALPSLRLRPDARCKRCGMPIAWGHVSVIFGTPMTPGRLADSRPDNRKWIPLDTDGMPHGCRKKDT